MNRYETFNKERKEKILNLRKADYKSGLEKIKTCRHSRKRLNQIKNRERSFRLSRIIKLDFT